MNKRAAISRPFIHLVISAIFCMTVPTVSRAFAAFFLNVFAGFGFIVNIVTIETADPTSKPAMIPFAVLDVDFDTFHSSVPRFTS